MKDKPALTVDLLWKLQRLGGVALSPDGRQAVCPLTSYSMDDNRSRTQLWLMPTDRAAPRALTVCGVSDSQPTWSPQGDRIAFLSKRDQQGEADDARQLYVIQADGGEAHRVSHFGPGIEGFRWLPDGKRVLFSAWVWPGLKGSRAQSKRQQAFNERKETGYATSQAHYRYWDSNLPDGRRVHLHLLDVASGRVSDLLEGTGYELPREDPGAQHFDISPDGRHVVFMHDPAAIKVPGQPMALAEMDLRTRRVRLLVHDTAWDFDAPRYSPDGLRIACVATEVGRRHTAHGQLAIVQRGRRPSWQALGGDWDHGVNAPLQWAPDGQSLLFTADQRGRCHLWRHTLAGARVDGLDDVSATPSAKPAFEIVHTGGWVHSFGVAATAHADDSPASELIVCAADSALHPVRLIALRTGEKPLRLEAFNDVTLAGCQLGDVREVNVTGAQGDAVQMWLAFPPGFDAKKRHPAIQVIHGGPYMAAGDTFSYRWNPHLLAARGQVVAQVNFHGSTGFGFAFKDSIVGRQGELEMQDIEAGTDWLRRQRWVDRSRIHAAGGSYGGFMVAWMNGHVAKKRYASMVCHAGVFDRIATFSADSYAQRPKDLQALYWEDMQKVLAQSPMNFAAQMHTPTLVIHGALDYRVPDCNGLAYYNTLKARGVDARLLWFPDENHWVQKPRNSKQWYAEFLDWVQSHRLA